MEPLKMMNRVATTALSAMLLMGIAGCSTLTTAKRPEVPDGDKCLALYAQVDAQIDAAGVRDAGYYRIEGFPYIRSDRYSASFARQIPDIDAFWEWVGYLRANEDESREIELRNLNLGAEKASSLLLDMRGCGAWLRSWELDDSAFRERLLDAVNPPDEYSTAQRALGFYPLAVPFLNNGIAERQREVEADFAKPLQSLEAPGEMVLWKATPIPAPDYPPGTIDLRTKPRDRLGRIGMLGSEVTHLAHTHAPALWIETAGDFDRVGAPVHGANGPSVDVKQPIVYYLPSMTRFGGRQLLQFNYFIWFSERAPRQPGDPEAGALDGLIWRVTLDEQGRPLLHDTIRASGSEHLGFLSQPLQRREANGEGDPILLPQAEVPADGIAVRLKSGTHEVRRVVAPEQAAATSQASYELRTYEELLTLPNPAGGTRSLFGPEGTVIGSEREDPQWSWSSGVRNAGAMRQWGRHATAMVGRAHFDDPFLFDQLFVAPNPLPAAVSVKMKPAPEIDKSATDVMPGG